MARYRDAIDWIALNDDTEWLDDEHGAFSVTLALVADLFGKSMDEATADLRKACRRRESITAAETGRTSEKRKAAVTARR
jgi:hypothetical protein